MDISLLPTAGRAIEASRPLEQEKGTGHEALTKVLAIC
jgi:hypothetical protein